MYLVKAVTITLFFLVSADSAATDRWYNQAIVDQGARLFQQNCAVCHGVKAEGTADWKQADANGNYPPPPLDGSAHAWHHSLAQLTRSIRQGGVPLGGVMPGFGDRLDDAELLAVIAYFQSQWPDQIYEIWHARHMQ